MIIVNFKTYESAVGENAISLAKIHEVIAKETGANIGVAVNALDLEKVIEAVEIPPNLDEEGRRSPDGDPAPVDDLGVARVADRECGAQHRRIREIGE